jgi:pilus assembly protein CpaB
MYDSNNSEKVQTESIYVAAVNVPSWKAITPQAVKLEEWPKDKIPPGAARTLEEFEGMRARVPLYPGEPIMASKLSDGNSGAFSERIPPGYQVFAVKVDPESSLSGLVLPGDKVDVLVFMEADSQARSGRTITMDLVKQTGTRTILRNVSVFAVNDRIGRNVEEEETSIVAKTVSLLVKPDESERLLLAKQLGTIHLALRKPGDETVLETSGATPSDLNDAKEAGDGSELAARKNDANGPDDIFDMLEEMKTDPTIVADTSIEAKSSAARITVIMSPTGIVGTFTHAKEGQLPQEMMRNTGVSSSKTEFDNNSSSDNDRLDGAGTDDIIPFGDDDVDPDFLGL